jgi:uncharacterized protein YciI
MKIVIIFLLSLSYLACAQDKRFMFVFLNSKPDKAELSKDELDKLMKGHLANIERLAAEGKLIVAGPFDEGGGIFIFNSSSATEVNTWLSTDPGIQAHRWNIEILPYTARVGSPCAIHKPYEMVTYEFIRFIMDTTKTNRRPASETARVHDNYLKKIIRVGHVIAEGNFNEGGGILIIEGDVPKKMIEADPALKDGRYHVEFKKLWVAKGAFCEK